MENKKIILSLNGIRFLMILPVFVVHSFLLYDFFDDKISIFCKSSFAVNYFFILSGFGMMLSYLRKNACNEDIVSFRQSIHFGFSHVKRTYPFYFSLTTLLFIRTIIENIFKNAPKNTYIMSSINFIINLPLLQSLTGSSSFILPLNAAAWFLSTLFIIYFFCPLLMKLIRTKSKNILSDILGIVLCATISIAISFCLEAINNKVGTISLGRSTKPSLDFLPYTHPVYRVFYVMAGMFIAKIFYTLSCKNFCLKSNTLLEILIFSLFLFNYFFGGRVTYRWLFLLIDFLLACCFIFVFAFDSGKLSAFFSKKPLQYLGNITMYFFLLHTPVIKAVRLFPFDSSSPEKALIQILIMLICSIILSFISDRIMKKFTK